METENNYGDESPYMQTGEYTGGSFMGAAPLNMPMTQSSNFSFILVIVIIIVLMMMMCMCVVNKSYFSSSKRSPQFY